MEVIAVANQKGGVGKTTTAVNLAASLCVTHQQVLLVDLDPQGNATMGSGVNKNSLDKTLYDLIIGDLKFSEVMQSTNDAGYAPNTNAFLVKIINVLKSPDANKRPGIIVEIKNIILFNMLFTGSVYFCPRIIPIPWKAPHKMKVVLAPCHNPQTIIVIKIPE